MPGPESRPDPAATLRTLAHPGSVLAGLIRLLGAAWRRFSDQPDATTLTDLERAVGAAADQLRALRVLLESEAMERVEPTAAPQQSPSIAARPGVDRPVSERRRDGSAGLEAEEAEASARRPDGPTAREAQPADHLGFPAFRDQNTGLFTREGFDALASGELKRCRRYERPFSLLLLQLDVADREPLRSAAATVRRSLRESDLAGRHVDRTFALALAETQLSDARVVARRVIGSLQDTGVWGTGARVGVAGHPIDGDTLPSLFEVARGQLSRSVTEVLSGSGNGA